MERLKRKNKRCSSSGVVLVPEQTTWLFKRSMWRFTISPFQTPAAHDPNHGVPDGGQQDGFNAIMATGKQTSSIILVELEIKRYTN